MSVIGDLLEQYRVLSEGQKIKYKKGDRVIVNAFSAKIPGYHIGTITQEGDAPIILLDGGEEVQYRNTTSKTGLLGLAKITKDHPGQIPNEDLDKWLK